MERIGILLEKIKDLNTKPDPSLIEIDLMMDYARVLYADLFEWRKKVAFNDGLIVKTDVKEEKETKPDIAHEVAAAFEANQIPLQKAEVTAPSIELDSTVLHFEQLSTDTTPALPLPLPHYSSADIRQQIGVNDKYLFISELFSNNKDAYEEVISELNTFDTEEEAVSWLKTGVAGQFHWREEDETVQSFYKLLSAFFASR